MKRPSSNVDRRLQKKRQEAERLRAFSPAETIAMGSDLVAFGLEVREAAKRALH